MVLNSIFQISVIIFCLVGTVLMVTVFIWTIMLGEQIDKLIKKLEEIANVAKITADHTKDFVDKTIESLETFKKSVFTFDFIGRIVTEIIGFIKSSNKEQIK